MRPNLMTNLIKNGLLVLSLTFSLFIVGCASILTPPVIEPKTPAYVGGTAQVPSLLPMERLVDKTQVKAALLIPLSGVNSSLGQALSNAAELAVFELADPRFHLIPLDTQSTIKGAQDAAQKAILEGVDIILGPLLAREVQAITPIIQVAGIPVIAFTSDPVVLGQGIFSVGLTPDTQIERMISFARSQGMTRFGLLARNDAYGVAVSRAFETIVPAQGGAIVAMGNYSSKEQDNNANIQQFMSSVQAVGGLDALMIAENSEILQNIVSLTVFNGLDPLQVRLLGNLTWDNPALRSDDSLHGAWFPAIADTSHKEFKTRYEAAFGPLIPKISPLAALSYEATALAVVLARHPDGNYGTAALTNPDGFVGVDGIFRFHANGTAERGFAVQEITGQEPKTLSLSPTYF